MATRHELTRDGVRLSYRDFGGDGPAILLLHGLAGHGGEWAQTASWLTAGHRVLAPDARGHGRSERRPVDVSRDALVADAAAIVQSAAPAGGSVIVVGQSLGGVAALSLAARRPDLVHGLVVADASPEGNLEAAEAAGRAVGAALHQWPVPFDSLTEAAQFFAERFGGPVAATAWTAGLEERVDGWWPAFDVDVMERMLCEVTRAPAWADWERVSCPALVIRAGDGLVDPETARAMVARLPEAQLVELAGAAHDLHLDRPEEWRAALSGFLDSLGCGG
ncbi:MAG TPA: alpha/beta hydrolase [Solirubrobacteraceae bacterium]|nr:alpha/beta hydrolase [Solirubrobacteraceae bacterium]